MALWEADNTFTRWVHGLCAIPVLAFVAFDLLVIRANYAQGAGYSTQTDAEEASLAGAIYLACRLLWYAITRRNCLNREDCD
jgi:hypothetical protein